MRRSRAALPLLLAAAAGLLYHLLMKPMGGDDVFFAEALRGSSLLEYLSHRYLHWTSRVVSEFILVLVIQAPLLWRVIDFLMFASFPLLFARLFDDSLLMRWCGAAAVLLFRFMIWGRRAGSLRRSRIFGRFGESFLLRFCLRSCGRGSRSTRRRRF